VPLLENDVMPEESVYAPVLPAIGKSCALLIFIIL